MHHGPCARHPKSDDTQLVLVYCTLKVPHARSVSRTNLGRSGCERCNRRLKVPGGKQALTGTILIAPRPLRLVAGRLVVVAVGLLAGGLVTGGLVSSLE